MAWRSHGTTNSTLIQALQANSLLTTPSLIAAMLATDRAHFAPSLQKAYTDAPQPIGHGATISAPHMHAHALESLAPSLHPGAKVLDVGSGSGYLTNVLARLVGERGMVVGVEHIDALTRAAIANTEKSAEGREFLAEGRLKFVTADGRLGWREEAPYDAIHVGAAAAEFHTELEEQLKEGGRMFVPVTDREGSDQYVFEVVKDGKGEVERRRRFGVRYVPLCDRPGG